MIVAAGGSLVVDLVTVPLFTGVIGYITNWTGVLMLFRPLRFYGIRVPGLKLLFPLLPRRVQVIPAISSDGRFGWQGIVPSRVDKMASIAVDKALSKVGSIGDFYQQLEPDRIAEHLVSRASGEVRGVVERIMVREHPQLWRDLPSPLKEALIARVERRLPEIVHSVTDQFGQHVDQLIDAKLMVIRYFRSHPERMNALFQEIGRKELRFIQNFGLYLGVPLGFVLVAVLRVYPMWWVLPLGGVVIGYAVNYLGIHMIFEPVFPRRVGPLTVQGLFIKRQPEVSEVFGTIIAEEVINLHNIGEELLRGPRSDRTRRILESTLRPEIDRSLGRARAAARVAIGTEEYDRIRESLAVEGAGVVAGFDDEEFNREQARKIKVFVTAQMRKLPPDEFSELLRSAIQQDEWLLFVHGGVLGLGAGFLHLALLGT
jgi:uncharacterized membrane protein YheB (UPF0754 family)